jgi:uncharacterized protein (TIGR02217 family)
MPGFHEVRFPPDISYGSTGGPMRRTDVVTLRSGSEERNSIWSGSLRRYDAGYGVRTFADLAAVVAFWEERSGRLYGFRWKDHMDCHSTVPTASVTPLDQAIGTGNGSKTAFQLTKTYGAAYAPWTRVIRKPVNGTVRVAVAGTELMSGWSVDVTTGIVTFSSAPALGAAITAGFEFDVPARFDTDQITINISYFQAGQIQSIPIMELLNP